MNTEETFGNRIKRLRERMGINKAELSRLAGMTRTAMGQYEERDTAAKCTIQHLQSISDVLSVSMEYLVNGQERHATIDEAVRLGLWASWMNCCLPEPRRRRPSS